MATTTRILVATEGARACFRVRGRGDFRASEDLRAAIRHLRAHGAEAFCFDLTDCGALDSTFIGVMAGPLRRLPDVPNGERTCRVTVHGISPHLRETLDDMGIAPLVQFVETTGFEGGFAETEPQQASKTDLARASIEAHENLMALDPTRNETRFRDVVNYLRDEARDRG
ncbi:MAG: STAS domain-containing protein [Verrucomicrobiae bacterium]|nr:STAS domain-containing protein [Verrucomicrobiae bacterium]MCP5520625.1 STAS domain-containing protein [Verrucomicrobiales bacterium]